LHEISNPVIIIGMSRSGTSLLTRMLESLGLFVGKRKDRNNEALFFVDLNKWFLDQCSAGLENPGPIRYLIENQEAREAYAYYVRDILNSPKVISYLGFTKYLLYGSPFKLNIPWGWKDPRNTFTLPIWLDVFPNAKVIHISRHALDVISSLMVRRDRGLSKLKDKAGGFKQSYLRYIMHKFVPKKKIVEMRCSSFEEGLNMWEEYMEEAHKHSHELKDNSIEIRYEDLLMQSEIILEKITGFCGLKTTHNDIKRVAKIANKDRAFAYLKDPELHAYASSPDVVKRLSVYGY